MLMLRKGGVVVETKKVRINTLIPENILKKIDSFGGEMGLSRGNAISVIAKFYFDQQEALSMVELLKIQEENPTKKE